MIQPGEDLIRSLARLSADPEFKAFVVWVEDSHKRDLDDLMSSKETVIVHQCQGSARALMDILQAIRSAPATIDAIDRSKRMNT